MPGSNPLFGLNTLGGALVDSDQGRPDQPRHRGARDLRQRRAAGRGVRARRQPRERAALVSRRQSSSRRTAGATTRRRRSASSSASSAGMPPSSDTALSVGYADNSLTGNGLQEQRLAGPRLRERLHEARQDRQSRDVSQSDHAARLEPHADLQRQRATTATSAPTRFNGDINDDSLDQSVYQPSAAEQRALAAAGYTGFPTSGANAANTPFPVLALHRQRAAERRARREMQRPPQPQRHRPAQLRRCRGR